MDFESPDVEKDFPGLYASESVRKCNDSDFSDENHDKSFKKESIIGKKKDKKDFKKDRGYEALGGDSSPEEDVDSRSPYKSKKSKSFKFTTKKSEKREKSREKDLEKRDCDKDKKKEKEKKEKEKMKYKEKKKIKPTEEVLEASEDLHIFGVSLPIAVERSGCLDGIPIPLVVRNCIDCIHEFGLKTDGLYKIVGMKSKVQFLRKAYNARDPVSLGESDVFVSTCLLRMFLRELPEPILTNHLLERFEEAGAIMEVDIRERELQNLLTQLPTENRILLGWLIVHFDTVTMHEKQNKLNAQSIAMTFSPVLQMSHRLLTAFLCHCKALFPNVVIERYIPPLCPGSTFPEKPDEIAVELKKQEYLLNQIHKEMSEGFISKKKEEQLWEVQRIVTELKRKLRSIQRFQKQSQVNKSLDEDTSLNDESVYDINKQTSGKDDIHIFEKNHKQIELDSNNLEDKLSNLESKEVIKNTEDTLESDNSAEKLSGKPSSIGLNVVRKDITFEKLKAQLEYDHLIKFKSSIMDRIDREKALIAKLETEIQSYSNKITKVQVTNETETDVEKLEKDCQMLHLKMRSLATKIFEERLACIKLKVYIDYLEMPERGE